MTVISTVRIGKKTYTQFRNIKVRIDISKKAIGGKNRILDIQPTELHQRVPFFCGSRNMVMKLQEFLAKYH